MNVKKEILLAINEITEKIQEKDCINVKVVIEFTITKTDTVVTIT